MCFIGKGFEARERFDLIHFSCRLLALSLSDRFQIPNVSTLHGRLDLSRACSSLPSVSIDAVISISDAQRLPLPWLNWKGTVHHGLPKTFYRFTEKTRKLSRVSSRVSPEKGLEAAIFHCKAGREWKRLKIAAKVDKADRDYYHESISPIIKSEPLVEVFGRNRRFGQGDFSR